MISPVDYLPAELRDYGLRDAHPFPLVSAGKRPGEPFSSRRVPASEAWGFPEVEYGQTPTSYGAVLVDIDGPDSAARLDVAVLARAVQRPSWVVLRLSSGGVHAAWALAVPVHRYPGARSRPLELFGRVSEYYTLELGGDPGYGGVLAHNPISSVYETHFMYPGGWSLEELADPIPAGWRRPSRAKRAKLESATERNVTLFQELCHFAGRLGRSVYDIEREADRINASFLPLLPPLGTNEVRGVINSVLRYRARWERRAHSPVFIEDQRRRGRLALGRPRGGSVSKAVSNEAIKVWDLLGLSRAAWYRRRAAQRERIRAINRGDPKSETEAYTDRWLLRAQQGAPIVLPDGQCLCSEIGSACERCCHIKPGPVITLPDGHKIEVRYVKRREHCQ